MTYMKILNFKSHGIRFSCRFGPVKQENPSKCYSETSKYLEMIEDDDVS